MFHLIGKHFLDATAHGVNHIEMHHRATQACVAEKTVWTLRLQRVLQRAGNKRTAVSVVGEAGILHQVYALLKV